MVDKLTGGLVGLAKQRKVEVVHGTGSSPARTLRVGDREISFENRIIAAGSQAARSRACPRTSASSTPPARCRRPIPGRLLVIGGGIIGLEMASVYDALGAKVTVVELLDHLIPGCDPISCAC